MRGVVRGADGALWFTTRDGTVYGWARGGDPVAMVEGGAPSSTGLSPWAGVGLMWGDQHGRAHVYDGHEHDVVELSGAPLQWPLLAVGSSSRRATTPVVLSEDGAVHTLHHTPTGPRAELVGRMARRPSAAPSLVLSPDSMELVSVDDDSQPAVRSLGEPTMGDVLTGFEGSMVSAGTQVLGGRLAPAMTRIVLDEAAALIAGDVDALHASDFDRYAHTLTLSLARLVGVMRHHYAWVAARVDASIAARATTQREDTPPGLGRVGMVTPPTRTWSSHDDPDLLR